MCGYSVPSSNPLMVQWIIRSILIGDGGPIELFLVPASAPWLVYQKPWYVLSCLLDGAYKRTLAAAADFLSHISDVI